MADRKSFGQVAYEAYGDLAGAHGPWKTFDGRPMPRWDELAGEAGALTKARWERGVEAAIAELNSRRDAYRIDVTSRPGT